MKKSTTSIYQDWGPSGYTPESQHNSWYIRIGGHFVRFKMKRHAGLYRTSLGVASFKKYPTETWILFCRFNCFKYSMSAGDQEMGLSREIQTERDLFCSCVELDSSSVVLILLMFLNQSSPLYLAPPMCWRCWLILTTFWSTRSRILARKAFETEYFPYRIAFRSTAEPRGFGLSKPYIVGPYKPSLTNTSDAISMAIKI
jgi:hypothetical protein